jgi:hypothetical protein
MAYAMAHKGRATSYVSYNPEDPPSAYNNATVHSRLSQYIEVAKEIHGLEYDPTTANLDGEVVMRAGGGKKHGRYWIGDNTIDTAATPSLSQIRARSTRSSPAIRERPSTAQQRVDELQVISVFSSFIDSHTL